LRRSAVLYTVYQTRNRLNDKIYIGCHATDNAEDDYLGSGVVLKRAIAKYGRSAFEKKVLYIFHTPEEMFKKERELVSRLFLEREDTYNLAEGGHGGFRGVEAHATQALKMKGRSPSRKAIETSAERRKGSSDPEEVRARKKLAAQSMFKGHTRGRIRVIKVETDEVQIKYIENSQLKLYLSEGLTRETPLAVREKCSHKVSEAQKAKQIAALAEYYSTHEGPNKGRVFSEAQRQKMSEAHKGIPSGRGRAVRNKETGEQFASMMAAGLTVSRAATGIESAAKEGGRCGGFHWEFIDV